MENHLEKLLADHCGAVLLGAKPAALFTLEHAENEAEAAAVLLGERGIAITVLRRSCRRTLVLAYAPALLRRVLNHSVAQKWLCRLGYPVQSNLEPALAHLKARFAQDKFFPHEIGFFLGYPPCDVVGFIYYGGRQYKHCCMWKVYGDVNKAKTLCEEFNLCRCICRQHIEKGGRIRTLPQPVCVNKAG